MPEVRALATDAVILLEGEIVLLKRNHPPHAGSWVLPGGLVEPDETARAACVRETNEEVGLSVDVVEFVGLYDDPDRDERGNVSAAYRCRPREEQQTPRAGDEATHVKTFPPASLPTLGFDHRRIIEDAVGPE